jgi:hypothetical protein
VQTGKLSEQTLATAARRFQTVRDRYEKPIGDAAGLSALRTPAHLQLVARISSRVEASLSQVGADPTEITKRLRIE